MDADEQYREDMRQVVLVAECNAARISRWLEVAGVERTKANVRQAIKALIDDGELEGSDPMRLYEIFTGSHLDAGKEDFLVELESFATKKETT